MDNIKVYEPEAIEDAPFPLQEEGYYDVSQKTSNETYSTQNINDNAFPTKRIAIELLSTVLNTKSKKILQEFELVDQGGMRIGKYQNGISGEVIITPAGIIAKDTTGEETIAVDAETGDVAIKGQLRAGSTIVANTIVNEQASNGQGRTVYYNDGLPSIVIGDPS